MTRDQTRQAELTTHDEMTPSPSGSNYLHNGKEAAHLRQDQGSPSRHNRQCRAAQNLDNDQPEQGPKR
jgi:hypothetical protein